MGTVKDMLKGCQKKIIMVKDTNSRYFESAYFVIKSGLPSSAKSADMLAEAHRLIADYSSAVALENTSETDNNVQPPKPQTPSHGLALSVILALAVIGIAAAAVIVIV